jgi:prepilin-type N-terminal cleavage/methylation domain-containing protein
MRERDGEHGFTLIELLVVIVIVAILAAIAIPLFYRQRERGHEAQVQASLKSAAQAVEAYSTEPGVNGSYLGLDGGTDADLTALGFRMPAYLEYLNIEATATQFCIETRHSSLTGTSPWRRGTYLSDNGVPRPTPDNCNPL